ncbi:response regulator [Aestuariivivens insulae]|uniref:response regulator n=1 Tax=Aestuariivivens insulae TaxID=1621988 RepID=UPI001F5995F5|nr:response regulator [Aestuariivivens insulae]
MTKRIKVLYVDDDHINLKLFDIVFSKKFDVVIAENGVEGIKSLKNNTDIDIVISDMKMPIMNGLEFINKAKDMFPDKPFCILTGFEITNEITDALNTGLIVNYFKKPFNRIELESVIEKVR